MSFVLRALERHGAMDAWPGPRLISRLEWQFERAHAGPVNALATYPDGFVSGGKDGRVRLWSGLDPVKVPRGGGAGWPGGGEEGGGWQARVGRGAGDRRR